MRRIKELDALRGLAALTILVYHVRYVEKYPALRLAVDLFFVLSGYLITAIILRERDRPGFLKTFLARRGLRIYPIYYLTFVLVILFNPITNRPQPLEGGFYYATYTQNIVRYWGDNPPTFSKYFGHTWTLAIEEQFYLIWPILLLLVSRRNVPWLIAALLPLPMILRAIGIWPHLLGTRCDGLLLGALLACLVSEETLRNGISRRLRWGFALSIVIGLGYPLGRVWLLQEGWPKYGDEFATPGANAFNLFAVNLAFFGLTGLTLANAGQPWLALLRSRILCGLGTISYGLYLYHQLIVGLVHRGVEASGFEIKHQTENHLKIALSILAAVASWFLLERPILNWKRRFEYESKGQRKSERKTNPAGPYPAPHIAIQSEEAIASATPTPRPTLRNRS